MSPSRLQGQRFTSVIISPHLDDAVFSCSELIRQGQATESFLVINIFTQYADADHNSQVPLTKIRYDEESRASTELGFTSVSLGIPDAIFREETQGRIGKVFTTTPDAVSQKTRELILERLAAILVNLDFEKILCPLGVGWHLDHLLTFEIVNSLSDKLNYSSRLHYYADVPYAWLRGATELRLHSLNFEVENNLMNPGRSKIEILGYWWRVSSDFRQLHFVNKIKSSWLRFGATIFMSIFFMRQIFAHLSHSSRTKYKLKNAPTETTISSRPILSPVTFANEIESLLIARKIEKKIQDMNHYESQFKEFFSSPKEAEEMLRNFVQESAPFEIERYFKNKKSESEPAV